MKAAPFAYVRPATVDDVVEELAGADDAKVLAGGQSLVPMMAMRLARPATLVDINAVDGIADLHVDDGALRVGATVRQRQVEHDPVAAAVPLLGSALPWVGHRELRTRGTVCGSIAHADPAAELPAVAVCLDASVEIAGPSGRREVPARELFTGAMTTQVGADELVVSVGFPEAAAGEGFGFAELARRHGDFALAGVVAKVGLAGAGTTDRVRAELACFGVSDTPMYRDVSETLRAALAEAGDDAPEDELSSALTGGAEAIADDVVQTGGDAHASTAYRRRLVAALAAREIARAHARARDSRTREDER